MQKIENKQTAFIENTTSFSFKKIIPVVVLVLFFLLVVVFLNTLKEPPVVIPPKPEGFLVETAQVLATDIDLIISSQGTVKAKRQISLVSEISGKVLSMNDAFVVGGKFAKGEFLVGIDPADYQVAVQRAKANLAASQSNLDLEKARSEQARKDWESFGKKGKPGDLLLNIPQLNGAKAALDAARADLAKAQRDLSKTRIIAPFDGTVIDKTIDLGQFVTIAGNLGTIAGTSVAELRLALNQDELERLNIATGDLTAANILVDFSGVNGEAIAEGLLVRIESSKDINTLQNYAVAEIIDPFSKNLFFNTFLQARIHSGILNNVYPIPTEWMMANNQIAIYMDDDTLNIVELEVVHKSADYFYVKSGISADDHIVTTPIQGPQIGMKLRKHQKTTTMDSSDTIIVGGV